MSLPVKIKDVLIKPTEGFMFTKDFFQDIFLFCCKTVRKRLMESANHWSLLIDLGCTRKPTCMLFELASESGSTAMASLEK